MTLNQLLKMKQNQQKIVCLTAYDAAFGHWVSAAGVDVILVGDSLGMVVQGHTTTLPVTLEQMVYHTQMVQRSNSTAWCIADLPFMADATLQDGLAAAKALMQAGANMVKFEGGQRAVALVARLSELGVPVCGHLGLLPQSVQKTGYRVQGRDAAAAEALMNDALALQAAGADLLVLECVPSDLARQISQALTIPVIGIGAGKDTDGQVLVLHDLLGLTLGKAPKFSHNFMTGADSIQQAIERYVTAVRNLEFPQPCHEMT
ncbi:3-methyl-2-oxobutanoate hydroxymethyltransferase [Thiosulfativibrio zosterae]|uniref:3-methyl-2-oxobutanoate hydroxymethyltransferase n=1 Tax=Thiosulfativibrio zosterae TaxID=2675053 RepID=A0A6F8PPJ1_9GAMM|nr:3-methyl-2-oxobutanoate hydroxymethyltransferase [Thiosulfativibrio zosterae]BBP44041.1 3-methyl-2-oxobutanoate hydroxymethyltransferase [Thiosulfativibrio zosterae]